jgi:3-deoxy-manno-octulosonate cytidylyltransferase (CMP-KDO synthetase)
VVAIIPARYGSTRFPGKLLATLKGKTIIQRVFEQVSAARLVDAVYVATDDKRIFEAVNGFGGNAIMTSTSHTCGTDRIAEVAKNMECDIIINVQGDEPFIRPEMVDDTVVLLKDDMNASISSLAVKIESKDDILSPHAVKVVADDEDYALYFSRSPIPYYRDEWSDLNSIVLESGNTVVFKHIGIYAFRKDSLIKFSSMAKCKLEEIQKLEQLRARNCGMKIKIKETEYNTFGIDTIEDLRKAEECQSIFL